VAFARVTVPWFAGGSCMPWRSFLVWNVLGGVTWVAAVGAAGYLFGAGAAAGFASLNAILLAVLAALGARAAWREVRE
jgi:membrane protein DedA with SNARE-associated domain